MGYRAIRAPYWRREFQGNVAERSYGTDRHSFLDDQNTGG